MKAMVLAAGYGTRMGSLTRKIPKPMLQVNGFPILAYILNNLVRNGFYEVVINLHFNPSGILDYFGDGSAFGASITYSYERELLGTAGGVKNVAEFFNHETEFLIHYGDVITNQDFLAMLAFHKEHNALATLLIHESKQSNSIVELDSNSCITGFLERPSAEQRRTSSSRWANSGICICDPEIIETIPNGRPVDLPRNVFAHLVSSNRLYGFPLSGYRCAIDSVNRLKSAELALSQGIENLNP